MIKIELWGAVSRTTKEIGRMYIANVGGTDDLGDYDVAVCRRGTTKCPSPVHSAGPSPTRVGQVLGYPRLRYNIWHLVVRALKSAFPEES